MTQNYKNHYVLFILQQAIRDFFRNDDFLEVQTPPMVTNPGMEPHIHPYKISRALHNETLDQYLHTSPEFCMKELLAEGFEKIFTQTFCFRDEPNSTYHRPQFIMLEWYRKHSHYEELIKDLINLIHFLTQYLPKYKIEIKKEYLNFQPIVKTVDEIFQEILSFSILDYLEKDKLFHYIKNNLPEVPLPLEQEDQLSWDDLYFLVFLNLIEPKLKQYPFLILKEFPHHLSALSTINTRDERVCNRFELYCHGIEIANCFGELNDLKEQKKRFIEDAQIKKDLYQYELPEPNILYGALEKGIGNSSGIALGVERLLGVVTKIEQPFYY